MCAITLVLLLYCTWSSWLPTQVQGESQIKEEEEEVNRCHWTTPQGMVQQQFSTTSIYYMVSSFWKQSGPPDDRVALCGLDFGGGGATEGEKWKAKHLPPPSGVRANQSHVHVGTINAEKRKKKNPLFCLGIRLTRFVRYLSHVFVFIRYSCTCTYPFFSSLEIGKKKKNEANKLRKK